MCAVDAAADPSGYKVGEIMDGWMKKAVRTATLHNSKG